MGNGKKSKRFIDDEAKDKESGSETEADTEGDEDEESELSLSAIDLQEIGNQVDERLAPLGRLVVLIARKLGVDFTLNDLVSPASVPVQSTISSDAQAPSTVGSKAVVRTQTQVRPLLVKGPTIQTSTNSTATPMETGDQEKPKPSFL